MNFAPEPPPPPTADQLAALGFGPRIRTAPFSRMTTWGFFISWTVMLLLAGTFLFADTLLETFSNSAPSKCASPPPPPLPAPPLLEPLDT
jgi:hypothetical protein